MSQNKYRLDAIDLKLLQCLHRDGRVSNARLAEVVCLSDSACFQRVKRLEQLKYITGYSATLAVERICPGAVTVFTTVKLASDQPPVLTAFETFLRGVPEAVEWHGIIGENDYLLRFVVPSLDRYRKIINEMMMEPLQVLAHTSLVTHRSSERPLDVASL